MSDDLKRLSDHAHSGEELLEGLLHARDDAEIDALIERGQRWRGELIDLGETVDPIRLRFRVVRPTPEETARIWPLPPEIRDDQRGYCYYLEAALWRLNIYLSQPDARPKGKVGRRSIDESKEIAEATRLMETEGLSANKAAGRIFPDNPSSQRRLYGKLPSKRALKTGTVKRRETV